jgi:hypothetical protein
VGDLRARDCCGRFLTEEVAAAIGMGVLRGLAAAHAAGLLHLDIKPSNGSNSQSLFMAGSRIPAASEGTRESGRDPCG